MKLKMPAILLAGAAALAAPLLVQRGPDVPLPETVTVPAGPFAYRPAGEFRRGGRVVDPPIETRMAGAPLEIMKYPVSRTDYAACVTDGGCSPAAPPTDAPLPQTDVSHRDALDYAAWLSDRTGRTWRLPTDAEWVRAAGERAIDDAVGAEGEDQAARWLAQYGRNVALRAEPDLEIRPIGSFGENSHGLVDISGNVWEWTDSCFVNAELDADGNRISETEYCGVRAAAGLHRAFIIDFVRDAKAGGCAVGLPPDHLGFRLVLD